MRSRAARFVSRLLPFVSALVATALVIFSAAGRERIKSYMDSLSFDGDAFTFLPSLFSTLVMSARLTGSVLLIAAVALFRFRSRVERGFDTLFAGTLEYLHRTASNARRMMRDETTAHRAAVLAIIVLGIVRRVRALWLTATSQMLIAYSVCARGYTMLLDLVAVRSPTAARGAVIA